MTSETISDRRISRDELWAEGRRLHALAALAAPQPLEKGPLNGLTFVAKDMFAWPGHACSRGLADPLPAEGKAAIFLRQLVAEGAELLGFAEMTPLAYEPSGGNPDRGRPINPRNASFICGGSSSGSAVLVAAGLVDFAVGSDTAGSLRIPAQCCGIAAWKPSYDRFCRTGSYPLAPSLDTLGLLAREVETFIRIGRAILPTRTEAPLRIAIAGDLAWPDPADGARVRAAIGDRFGGTVALQNVLDLCDDVVLTLLQREAYDSNRALLAAGALDPVLTRRLAHGANITDAQYEAARAGLAVLRMEMAERLFQTCEVIAFPVMPIRTPRVAECEPGSPEFSARTLYALSRYTRFVNALGLPAASIPIAAQDGAMPTAVQFIARRGLGMAVLRAAHHVEQGLKGSAA